MIKPHLYNLLMAALFGLAIFGMYMILPTWRPSSHDWEGWRAILSGLSFLAGATYMSFLIQHKGK